MKRRKEREFALQILYALEYNDVSFSEQIELLDKQYQFQNTEFARQLIKLVVENKDELDELIKTQLHNWDFTRVAVIDRILLRMALVEFGYFPDVPAEVTLNEVIEISKEFSTDQSGKFLNGILDAILKKSREGKLEKPFKMYSESGKDK